MPRAAVHQREQFARLQTGVPELLMFGWERQTAARRSLASHTHHGAYEVCYIVDGHVDWWVENEVSEVGPGDLYFTRPEERHGGIDGVMHPSELYWIIFTLPEHGPMTGLTADETTRITHAITSMRQRCFRGSDRMPDLWRNLHAGLRNEGPLRSVSIRAAFHQMLLDMLQSHQAQRDRSGAISKPIQNAMAWIDEHASEDFPVERAAATAGWRASQFHDRFRREVGLSPAAYRTRRRIHLAKRLLRDPRLSVTDVALRAGFGTSQYFATVFKQQVGISPRTYRNKSEET